MARFSLYLANSMLIILVLGAWFNLLPKFIAILYLVLSTVTFIIYWFDKRQAKKAEQRISERTLHIFALIGGWPGAALAQQLLRHKSHKRPFRIIFWFTLMANLALFITLLSPAGKPVLIWLNQFS